MIVSIGANLSLVLRWQRARGDERQQIKGFALFVGVAVSVFLIIEITGQTSFPQVFKSPLYTLAFYLAWIGYPVVIGITVLKYRLYNVEIVVRKTMLYLGVTASLVVIYLTSVTIFQNIFMRLSGEESQAAVIISTLMIAALFNPLCRRLQSAIDRRFYRNKYDAEQALEKFRSGLRAEVNPDDLCSQLIQVVQDTVQPAFTSVWIRSLPAKKWEQQSQDPG